MYILILFQLPHERTPEHNESKESIEKIQETLITLSEHRFPLVMQGLSKLIKEPGVIVRIVLYHISIDKKCISIKYFRHFINLFHLSID